jgi:hypothetical protein
MKKTSADPLNATRLHSERSNGEAKALVRYVGFESVEGGRRLNFSVKPIGSASVEIIFEISDGAFTGIPGLSIQDAAPMVYEKLVEVMAAGGTIDPEKVCLTTADVAEYIKRHVRLHKRRTIKRAQRRPDAAA